MSNNNSTWNKTKQFYIQNSNLIQITFESRNYCNKQERKNDQQN